MRSQAVVPNLEILDLRHFSSADLRPLLEHEAALWSRAMSWDYSGSIEMVLRYIDSRILPGYVAIENGRPLGFSFFVYEGLKGVIGDLFTYCNDPAHDDRVRRTLLMHVVETLQQTPGIHRIEAQLLAHPSGRLMETFVEQGFHAHRRLFMDLSLRQQTDYRIDPNSEIQLRPWTEADFQAAAYVITGAYHEHIDSSINDQYRSTSGSLRFLNNIVRFPGCGTFDPGSSIVAVSRFTGGIVGLLLCSRVREDVGHVTQVCLLPEFRGHGLGKALVSACCANLRSQHFTALSLTVTEANHAAVELYKKLGFETRRVFDAFVWEK